MADRLGWSSEDGLCNDTLWAKPEVGDGGNNNNGPAGGTHERTQLVLITGSKYLFTCVTVSIKLP